MCKEAGGRRNKGDMRGQADTRLKKNTTVGMLRKSCCFDMGWWGCAKRNELDLAIPGVLRSAKLSPLSKPAGGPSTV
eukprot:5401119-Pyramimonas_sp.AAC.1